MAVAEMQDVLDGWSAEFAASGQVPAGFTVTTAVMARDLGYGFAIYLAARNPETDETRYFSPYFSQGDDARDDIASAAKDETVYLRGMLGATEWRDWQWVDETQSFPG